LENQEPQLENQISEESTPQSTPQISEQSAQQSDDQKPSQKQSTQWHFRVNRQGREIFNGPQADFEVAIKAQKIKADDLIWDTQSDSWTFARNHAIFREANNEAIESILKKKRAKDRKTWLLRGLTTFIIMGSIMWVLVHYSKQIEFNPKETFGESTADDAQEAKQKTEKTEKSQDQSSSGAGAGNQDQKSSADQLSLDDLKLLELIQEKQQKNTQDQIELVFDLKAEGNQINLESLDQNEGLSTSKLLQNAQKLLSNANGATQESYDQLQEARGIVDFILTKAQLQNAKDQTQKEAQNLMQRIEINLQSTCAKINSPKFCELKDKFPQWSNQIIKAVEKRKVLIGMNKDQATIAWGAPQREITEGNTVSYCYDANCNQLYQIKSAKVVNVKQ
jgi:hypothetical protein